MSEATSTFCPECGLGVPVDEDGCCVTCGCTAIGSAVEALYHARLRLVSPVAKIISGAMQGDQNKVNVYAHYLADLLERDGDAPNAARIRKIARNEAGARIRPAETPDD